MEKNKMSKGDIAHSIIKGGIGAIPVVGSLATEVFGMIVTPPLDKRKAEWMNEIAERLKKLEDQNLIEMEDLKDNDQFIDIILQTTTFALKTSEKDKINAFQNAIINTAKGESPDKTKSQIFLNLLDSFTIWHMRILHFIDSPRDWFKRNGKNPPSYMTASIHSVIEEAYPELKGQDVLLDIIWNDLKTAGFHRTGDLKSTMSGDGVLSDRTTSLGKEFINFITSNSN